MQNCNHTSVGVIVVRDGKALLFQRVQEPFGIAPVAGHVEVTETFAMAAGRELKEETGLIAHELTHLLSCHLENVCRRPGGDWHEWRVYLVDVGPEQEPRGKEDESRNLAWYSPDELTALMERTRAYLNLEVSQEEWEASPGMEPAWLELLERLAEAGTKIYA